MLLYMNLMLLYMNLDVNHAYYYKANLSFSFCNTYDYIKSKTNLNYYIRSYVQHGNKIKVRGIFNGVMNIIKKNIQTSDNKLNERVLFVHWRTVESMRCISE